MRRPIAWALTIASASAAQPLSAVLAGGGIGGLCAALTLRKAGIDVSVYEKTSEYRPFGGPIQIASNGLEALAQIDRGLLDDIRAAGTTIGDRKNGLKDGISNEWFATFDLYSPAISRGQEPSLVIDRPILQDLLLKRVGDSVTKGTEVVGCERNDDADRSVVALLADGSRHSADLLIGSDGLRSKVPPAYRRAPRRRAAPHAPSARPNTPRPAPRSRCAPC